MCSKKKIIECISIEGNTITDKGATALVEMLSFNKTLGEICFLNNDIVNEISIALSNRLKQKNWWLLKKISSDEPEISEVDLGDVGIDDDGAERLAR